VKFQEFERQCRALTPLIGDVPEEVLWDRIAKRFEVRFLPLVRTMLAQYADDLANNLSPDNVASADVRGLRNLVAKIEQKCLEENIPCGRSEWSGLDNL
jgi:hypothetical protein